MPRLPLEFTFVDNNGKTARTGFYLPRPATVQDADSATLALAGALSALSSAGLQSARWTFFVDSWTATAAEPGSNCYERGLYIFRENALRGVLSIPSPDPLSFDVEGPYRGLRISRARLDVLGVLAPLEAALAGVVLPDGTSFPSTFVVGGSDRLKP